MAARSLLPLPPRTRPRQAARYPRATETWWPPKAAESKLAGNFYVTERERRVVSGMRGRWPGPAGTAMAAGGSGYVSFLEDLPLVGDEARQARMVGVMATLERLIEINPWSARSNDIHARNATSLRGRCG